MSTAAKIVVVAGARPNFMKVAPILRRLREEAARTAGPRIEHRLVHTGQHYDDNMSRIFFAELGIPAPDINLEVGSGSQAAQTANVMTRFEPVCLEEKPNWVVVVGDVNSTLACALVCSKLGVRIAHVEAGLRSFDRSMPEEVNRVVTDALADLLLTPSADADANLHREGLAPERIRRVGNVMIDTLVVHLERARASGVLQRLGLRRRGFAYVTLHRPANVDDPAALTSIMVAIGHIAADLPVVFAMHPRTRKMCERLGIAFDDRPGLIVLEPLGYHDSIGLADAARFVLTDSGGLQEETTFLRTPCLTLRPSTERPVTVTVGSNRLTRPERLSADVATLLDGPETLGEAPPLWDGRTAERIVSCLLEAA